MQKQKTIFGTVLAVLVLSLCSSFTRANTPEKDKQAEKIFRNYVTAIGGEKNLSNISNLLISSSSTFSESGLTIERELFTSKSDKLLMTATAPQFGEMKRGYDGTNCWEKRPSGIREIRDEEKRSFLNEFAFMRYANWSKNLQSYKYLGQNEIAGEKMHKISVTTIFGANEIWYFNAENHLLAQVEETLKQAKGEVNILTIFSDYRKVDGVKHSFEQRIIAAGKTRNINIRSILVNQKIYNQLYSKPTE